MTWPSKPSEFYGVDYIKQILSSRFHQARFHLRAVVVVVAAVVAVVAVAAVRAVMIVTPIKAVWISSSRFNLAIPSSIFY